MAYKTMRMVRAIGFAAACLVTTASFAEQRISPRPTLPKYEFDKFELEIPAARSYSAPVNLYMPKVATRTRLPAVLLQFGAQGDKDVDYIVEIGEGLAKRGYVVMTMDMPGRGSRADQSPEPDTEEELVSWYMEDYKMGVDYLARLAAVDSARLSYAGTSLGAITGIPFCAKDKRIKACISIVGGGSANSDLPEELDCVKAVSKIAPRATMLVNGTFDFIIPYNMANNLHTRVQAPFEKIWYPADHYLRGIDKDAFYDRMASFMQTYARRR